MKRNGNALLVELMIVVLFFMLCATVLMQLFVSARNISYEAGCRSDALCEAQNLADRIFTSDDAPALLDSLEYEREGNVWTGTFGRYTMRAEVYDEILETGTMRRAQVEVINGEEGLIMLPCSRYFGGEAT